MMMQTRQWGLKNSSLHRENVSVSLEGWCCISLTVCPFKPCLSLWSFPETSTEYAHTHTTALVELKQHDAIFLAKSLKLLNEYLGVAFICPSDLQQHTDPAFLSPLGTSLWLFSVLIQKVGDWTCVGSSFLLASLLTLDFLDPQN